MGFTAVSVQLRTPLVISSVFSPWSAYADYAPQAGLPTSQTGPAANQAIYDPFVVTTTATFKRGFWWNGSVPNGASNVSVGIYDSDCSARLATTGNVLASGASVIQSAPFAADVTLSPGNYYMAIQWSVGATVNGVTAVSANIQRGRWTGLLTQATGVNPLPATATPATWISQLQPVYGISQMSFV